MVMGQVRGRKEAGGELKAVLQKMSSLVSGFQRVVCRCQHVANIVNLLGKRKPKFWKT